MKTHFLITAAKNLLVDLRVSAAAARALHRRLRQQTQLRRGQNLQMMDMAELGRPGLRAYLVHPLLARVLPSTRAVVRVLAVTYWIGTIVSGVLAIFAGMVGAALTGHFLLS